MLNRVKPVWIFIVTTWPVSLDMMNSAIYILYKLWEILGACHHSHLPAVSAATTMICTIALSPSSILPHLSRCTFRSVIHIHQLNFFLINRSVRHFLVFLYLCSTLSLPTPCSLFLTGTLPASWGCPSCPYPGKPWSITTSWQDYSWVRLVFYLVRGMWRCGWCRQVWGWLSRWWWGCEYCAWSVYRYVYHAWAGHLDHPPPCPPPPLSPGGHILQERRTTWWSDYMFIPHSFQPSGILGLRLRLLFSLSGK